MDAAAQPIARREPIDFDSSPTICPDLTAEFEQHIHAHRAALREVNCQFERLARAAVLISDSLTVGGRVYTCGNGGSAAEAEHFAAELIGRFRFDRRALAACSLTSDSAALTAIANDYGFDDVFARQVEALVRRGDVLLAISTSGESRNVIGAARAARHRRAAVIAMTGRRPSSLETLADITLQAPTSDTPTIQEVHMLFTHLLCDAVERRLCAVGAES